jgi:hypothetical protein
MERKPGCCSKVQKLQAELALKEKQLCIALRALETYKLSADPLIASDALARMQTIAPLPDFRKLGG